MRKKILAMLLCVTTVLSFCACGNNGSNDGTEQGSENAKVDPPTIESLAEFDNIKEILTGDYEITDDVIELEFKNMLYSAGGGLADLGDKPAEKGDIVEVDFQGYYKDGKTMGDSAKGVGALIDIDENASINSSTGATAGGYIEGFSKGLFGAKAGDKLGYDVTFPDPYTPNEDLSGETVTFKFEVKKVYEPITPDNITDERVAKYLEKTYGLTTVDGFMKYVEEEMAYRAVMAYVTTKSKVTIPTNYTDYRVDLYADFYQEFYCGENELEDVLKNYYNMTLSEARTQWAQSLKSNITYETVFAEMIKSKNIKTDESALKAYVDDVLKINSTFKDADSIYKFAGVGDVEAGKEYLLNELALRDYILSAYRATKAETK